LFGQDEAQLDRTESVIRFCREPLFVTICDIKNRNRIACLRDSVVARLPRQIGNQDASDETQ
jgi:hypothetical protein